MHRLMTALYRGLVTRAGEGAGSDDPRTARTLVEVDQPSHVSATPTAMPPSHSMS